MDFTKAIDLLRGRVVELRLDTDSPGMTALRIEEAASDYSALFSAGLRATTGFNIKQIGGANLKISAVDNRGVSNFQELVRALHAEGILK